MSSRKLCHWVEIYSRRPLCKQEHDICELQFQPNKNTEAVREVFVIKHNFQEHNSEQELKEGNNIFIIYYYILFSLFYESLLKNTHIIFEHTHV